MRRKLQITLLVLVFALVAAPQTNAVRATADQPVALALDSIGITVSDADRSAEFFARVLNFQKVREYEVLGSQWEHFHGLFGMRARIVRMKLGDEFIELTEYLTPKGRPIPVDSRSNDRWFQHIAIIVSDMDKAYAWLRQNRVEHASTGPQTIPEWNKAAGGIRAFYFKDSDQHALEVLWFPEGKGDPKWQRRDGSLFLGIDHTAIAVHDTDASLKFYRDTLGLKLAGEAENYGTEQEHLNNVFGARVRITALRAASGPGVEFLEYLAPRDGRPYPADARASDLFNWQTNFLSGDVRAAEMSLFKGKYGLVSPGAVDVKEAGIARGVTVRDPDGHSVRLIEK